jgi:hypothetical protein
MNAARLFELMQELADRSAYHNSFAVQFEMDRYGYVWVITNPVTFSSDQWSEADGDLNDNEPHHVPH